MRRSALLLFLASAFCLLSSPAARAQATPFLGQIMIVPYNFAPKGWEMCDGQLLPIQQYAALFSLLGTTYGGNGTSNFALPDLRGRVPIGYGQGPGLSPYVQGEAGGEEVVTLTVQQLPVHTHTAEGTASAANTVSPNMAYWAMPRALLYSAAAPNSMMSNSALAPAGGSQPHDNLKPFLVMTYVIAESGIFPSRN